MILQSCFGVSRGIKIKMNSGKVSHVCGVVSKVGRRFPFPTTNSGAANENDRLIT